MSDEEAPAQQQQNEVKADVPSGDPPSGPPDMSKEPEASQGGTAPEEEVFTYRTLVLTGHGGYDKIKLQVKSGKPSPKTGEVLVRIKACGLNFAELMGRQGLYELLSPPPVTMGMEGAGVIEAVGEEVTDRKVGDRVIVMARNGMWSEVVTADTDHTFLMPDGMSFEEGAAIPVNYLTAHMMLFQVANLRPGKALLIHMAAGGVGVAVTQLCQTVKNVTVFGTASASKHETILQGGVTHAIDYRTKDYVEEIRKICPEGIDIVLDPLGGADTQKGFNLLKPLGTLIVFGAANCVTGQKKNLLAMAKTWYNQFTINTMRLMQANKAISGFHLGYVTDRQLVRETMAALLDLYAQGRIKPRIDSTFHFEEVADAMRRMHERRNIGKVILLPEPKKEEQVQPESNPLPESKEEKVEEDVPEQKVEEAKSGEIKADEN